MKLRTNPFYNYVWLTIGAIVLFWALNNYDTVFGVVALIVGFLFPFLLGGGIAFLLNIPMRFMERKFLLLRKSDKPAGKWLRVISLLLTLAIVTAVILTVFLIVMPQLAATVVSIKDQIPGFIDSCRSALADMDKNLPDLQKWLDSMHLDVTKIEKQVTSFIGTLGGIALNSSLSFATSVFSGIVNFLLSAIFAIYLLMSKETLKRQANSCLNAYLQTSRAERMRYIGELTDKSFSAFFTGQCLEAFIIGALFFVGMTLLNFPYELLISVLIGFTALIPIFGAFIGCAVGAFLILVVDPMQAVWFVVFFLVVQQLEGNLIYPRVVGGSIGLPSLWVFVAVTLGGSMFGVLGMLLFIPVLSVVYTLITADVRKRLREKGLKAAAEVAAADGLDAPAVDDIIMAEGEGDVEHK